VSPNLWLKSVFGLSGRHLLRPFPQLKKALALRRAKLGVTRSIRPQQNQCAR
jgi:hypothetical protein